MKEIHESKQQVIAAAVAVCAKENKKLSKLPPTELQIRNALSLTTSDKKSKIWLPHVSNV